MTYLLCIDCQRPFPKPDGKQALQICGLCSGEVEHYDDADPREGGGDW